MHDRDVGEVESAHRPGSRTQRLQNVRERLLRDPGVVRLRHDRDLGNRKPWANVDRCLAAEHVVEIVEERRRGGNDRPQRLRQGACTGQLELARPDREVGGEQHARRDLVDEARRVGRGRDRLLAQGDSLQRAVLRVPVDAHAVAGGDEIGRRPRERRRRSERRLLAERREELLRLGAVRVRAHECVTDELRDRRLIRVVVRELRRGALDRVEGRLALRERRPAVDLLRHDSLVELAEERVELLLVTALRQPDELGLLARECDEVELGAERRLDVLGPAELRALREARAQVREHLVVPGKLVQQPVDRVPLAGRQVGIERDERDGVRGRDRGRRARAPARCDETDRYGRCCHDCDDDRSCPHRYSSVGCRPISLDTSSPRLCPESTAQTPSVIGNSTFMLCASSSSTGAVTSPSTVCPISAAASSGVRPWAISSPARRFRPWRLQHVTIRSPMPASPENVSGRAPNASPRRAISARPRVISAALELSPRSSPSTPPAASAITFFAAAQSSTPTTSGFTYARKTLELIACCNWPARKPSSLAITAAVGRPAAISVARFGPERTATPRPRTVVESRSPVAGSRPFVRLSTGASPGSPATTSANELLGTATTIASTSPGAAATVTTARTPRRSTRSRKRGLCPVSAMT